MMYFTIEDDHYWYEIYGNKGPPVVFLHGFTGRTTTWERVLPYIEETRFIILVDLPGHGNTQTRHKTMTECCRDLDALFRHLNLERFHLVGYSMGGRTALSYMTAYPDRVESLVLESASPGLADQTGKRARIDQDEKLAQRIEKDGVESFVEFWENLPLFQSQNRLELHVKASVRSERLSHSRAGLASSLRGMGTGAQSALWDYLPMLRQPVLLIAGELDEKFVGINREMATKLQNVTLNIVSDAGHAIHVEVPSIFGKMIVVHIKQHMP